MRKLFFLCWVACFIFPSIAFGKSIVVKNARVKVLPSLKLSEPLLGQSHFHRHINQRLQFSGRRSLQLGSVSQASTLHEFALGLVVTVGVIYLVGGLTLLGGNIAAAITHRRLLGWGIAGALFFGLFTISGIVAGVDQTFGSWTDGLIITLVNAAAFGLSIGNIVQWFRNGARGGRRYQRGRRFHRYGSLSPWFNVSRQTRAFSGGMVYSNQF